MKLPAHDELGTCRTNHDSDATTQDELVHTHCQAALERQDLSCLYLAHHEPESMLLLLTIDIDSIIVINCIVIIIIVIITVIFSVVIVVSIGLGICYYYH